MSSGYGVRSIGDMKHGIRPSERQQRRKVEAMKYFAEHVDPIIGPCITYLLCKQPEDAPKSMLEYLLALKNKNPLPIEVDVHSSARKDQRIYLTNYVAPVVSKLVNRIALKRPTAVVEAMYDELSSMINFDKGIYGKEYDRNAPPAAHAQNESFVTINDASRPATAENKKNIQIALLGAGSGGKSSIMNTLQGIFEENVKPTVGFRPVTMFLEDKSKIQFFDLGGSKKIRDIWNNYYHDIHGVIYVFDASSFRPPNEQFEVGDNVEGRLNRNDEWRFGRVLSAKEGTYEVEFEDGQIQRLCQGYIRSPGVSITPEADEMIELYNSTMLHPYLVGKSALIVINKQDIPGAITLSEFQSLMGMDEIPSHHRVVEGVSRYDPESGSQEWSSFWHNIEQGIEWLLSDIQGHYDEINVRVKEDSRRKAAEEAKKRMERERKVLRNKIAEAFPTLVDASLFPDGVPTNPEDIFDIDEGVNFLAGEIGVEPQNLPEKAQEIASLVGYQRLALQIVGALNCPISKKKFPMSWDEIYETVMELRQELGLPNL